MFLGWRRKKCHKKRPGLQDVEVAIPNHFRCPISFELMKDPVTLSSGITYDRDSIERWLELGNFTCPVTNEVLRNFDQIPNHTLRKMIQEWCVENRDYGFERIPTPRIPITEMDVFQIVQGVQDSSRRLNQYACLELIQKIKKWGMESQRNRRCIVENGMARVLAKVFEVFAADSYERNSTILEEIISALNWMIPLDEEAMKSLASPTSLRCMVWFLSSRDVSPKQNSILVLKELSSTQHVEKLAEIEKVNEVLFRLIKNPICTSTTITKASLTVIFNLISSSSCSDNMKSSFVKMGIISTLLELLIDSEKSMCEKALGVLDELCGCEKGREEAYRNDLTMPVLVKKILRVSEAATDFSVSAIWKLCKNNEKGTSYEEKALVEALQVGCFQKLLLLLQLGCGHQTKEKATELLKLLNPYRVGLECIESVDFKSLRRSF